MLVARLTCLRSLPGVAGLRPMLTHSGTLSPALRSSTLKACPPLLKPHQGYSTKGFGFRRGPGRTRMILTGVAAVGLGALCYYGQRKAMIWPQEVNDRIHSTYMYFAGSIGMAALSAVAVSRTPALMGLMMRGPWLAVGATFAAMIGADMLVTSISYEQSPMPKHLAWMLHAGVMGAVIAPLTLLGGPLMLRAAWYTAGIVGGLSTVAMCAPSEKFLYMGGPVAVGFGVQFASNIGSMFLPPHLGGLYSIAIYGGLLLFSAFLLYDTQKIIKRAETY